MKAAGDSLGISSNTVCYDLQVANQLVEGAVAEGYAKLDDYEQTVLDPYFEDENVRGEKIYGLRGISDRKVHVRGSCEAIH